MQRTLDIVTPDAKMLQRSCMRILSWNPPLVAISRIRGPFGRVTKVFCQRKKDFLRVVWHCPGVSCHSRLLRASIQKPVHFRTHHRLVLFGRKCSADFGPSGRAARRAGRSQTDFRFFGGVGSALVCDVTPPGACGGFPRSRAARADAWRLEAGA
jgi:hypothetical protein